MRILNHRSQILLRLVLIFVFILLEANWFKVEATKWSYTFVVLIICSALLGLFAPFV